jgi:hypothetical protein
MFSEANPETTTEMVVVSPFKSNRLGKNISGLWRSGVLYRQWA